MNVIMVLSLFFLVVTVIYAMLILSFLVRWVSIKTQADKSALTEGIYFSVVVAARDEEGCITDLLDALKDQDYDPGRYEVLVVDDHSADITARTVKDYIRKHRLSFFRLIVSAERGAEPGKKHALDLGIRDARGNYIVTTDADCCPGQGWLSAIAQGIAETGAGMVLGPVRSL